MATPLRSALTINKNICCLTCSQDVKIHKCYWPATRVRSPINCGVKISLLRVRMSIIGIKLNRNVPLAGQFIGGNLFAVSVVITFLWWAWAWGAKTAKPRQYAKQTEEDTQRLDNEFIKLLLMIVSISLWLLVLELFK